MKFRKIICIVLALAMALAMVTSGVYAEGEEPTTETTSFFDDIKEALKNTDVQTYLKELGIGAGFVAIPFAIAGIVKGVQAIQANKAAEEPVVEPEDPVVEPEPDPVVEPETKYDDSYKTCAKNETCPLEEFLDVKNNAWYHDGVHFCLDNGIVATNFGVFHPDESVTRAEFAYMLWKLAGSPYVNYAMPFTDVDTASDYAEAIRWAASEGIVDGTTPTTFNPDGIINRAQVATMIYRYAKTLGEGFTGAWVFLLPYDDLADIPSYASEAAHWTYMKGIITGTDNNMLPNKACTRAELCTMIMRLSEAL